MPSRKSTPRRARSSSVTSNASVASTRSRGRGTASKAPNSAASKASAADGAAADVPVASSDASERPPLPKRRNEVLPDADLPVKVQVIRRDAKNIIIGRVKLPTQNGADHAFLLKRFDTNAVVASSMFRIAFPWANKEEEEREMAYLDANYDTSGANGGYSRVAATPKKRGRPKKSSEAEVELVMPEGSTGVRLQGTWIPCADGLALAEEYGLLRWAKPLIEAQAEYSEDGPLLTPSKDDKVSVATPRSTKRARLPAADASSDAAGSVSPSVSRTKTTKRTHADGSQTVLVEKTETTLEPQGALTPAQIERQIKESQRLAADVKRSGSGASRGQKRKAANQRPSEHVDRLADEDEDDDDDEVSPDGNAVVRSLRRTARVARRRPIVTTASALGAAGAVGAGALAWLSGGNLDVASQLLQQGITTLGSWF